MNKNDKKEQYIFVYGTLRGKGMLPITELIDNRVIFVGKATIRAKMYLVDYYPGIIAGSSVNGCVHGEVYQLLNLPDYISILDEHEGVSSPPHKNDLFKKIFIEATLYKGNKIRCLAYAYNRKILPSMPFVESGDYLQEIDTTN